MQVVYRIHTCQVLKAGFHPTLTPPLKVPPPIPSICNPTPSPSACQSLSVRCNSLGFLNESAFALLFVFRRSAVPVQSLLRPFLHEHSTPHLFSSLFSTSALMRTHVVVRVDILRLFGGFAGVQGAFLDSGFDPDDNEDWTDNIGGLRQQYILYRYVSWCFGSLRGTQ